MGNNQVEVLFKVMGWAGFFKPIAWTQNLA